MSYLCVGETAKNRGVSESSKRSQSLAEVIRAEKSVRLSGGIYHKIQIDLTYNSNHIEGNKLSHEQTRYIFETNTIGTDGENLKIDDIIETVNHFRCVDIIIDSIGCPPDEALIKQLHSVLKSGTSDSRLDWFAVGDYKKIPNEVGGNETTPPENVRTEMHKLLTEYSAAKKKTFDDLLEFHWRFEAIHPFQDGNGRIGRLLLFKECLRHNIVPFIIDEDLKLYYYRGLREWPTQKGYLRDTCLAAQDKFKKVMDYFRIEYNGQ
ncbi:MAG: Fic family protein [Synergistes sp.]|nr:Fic family protein [Synergistes sp.]